MKHTLDCGHEPSPHGPHTTGTAHYDGKEICCNCADVLQREELKSSDTFFAYLSSTENALTTWTGGVLARITSLWSVKNNMAGSILRFRATDVHGKFWYGTAIGRGMYARMHRCKNQS